MLAQQDDYFKATEELEEISTDQQKRLEYTARQKALYDYNTLMEENYSRGMERGREQGRKARDMELAAKMREEGIDEQLIHKLFGNM